MTTTMTLRLDVANVYIALSSLLFAHKLNGVDVSCATVGRMIDNGYATVQASVADTLLNDDRVDGFTCIEET